MKARAVYTAAEQVGEDTGVQRYKSKVIDLSDDFLKPDGESHWHFMCLADIGKVEEERGTK